MVLPGRRAVLIGVDLRVVPVYVRFSYLCTRFLARARAGDTIKYDRGSEDARCPRVFCE